MSKHMFIEGDYILTIDTSKIDKVASFTDSYYFGLSDGTAEVVSKKYTRTIAELLELVKPNFQVIDFDDKPKVTYKFLSGCIASRFYLAFSNFRSYDTAWNLIEKEFTELHNAEGGGISKHSDLTFLVKFPLFYGDFEANRQTIINIIGEPVNG